VPGFLCAVLPEVFYHAEIAACKKGGVDGLVKLRSGAKRNGAILTALIFLETRFYKNAKTGL
jgi:hypothetical protein